MSAPLKAILFITIVSVFSACGGGSGASESPDNSSTGGSPSVDGGWLWSNWSECSAECGGGTQTRTATCSNPAPANGGSDCTGGDIESRVCNNQSCVETCDGGVQVDDICFKDFGIDSEFGYKAYLAASEIGGSNPPENVIDGYATWNTRWETTGSQWVELRLPQPQIINRVGLSFMKGDEAKFNSRITISMDRSNWITVHDGESSGRSTDVEYYYLNSETEVNHIRVELNGSNAGSANYLQEIKWGDQSQPMAFPQDSSANLDSCSYYNNDPTAISGGYYIATFENGLSNPEVGGNPMLGTDAGSTLAAVDNPYIDGCNSSNKVLEVVSAPSDPVFKTRAEYHTSPRMPINEKRYIYAWKQYLPEGFLDDVEVDFMSLSQWKTWPCGRFDSPSPSAYPADSPINYSEINYENYICEGGGIFNDLGYRPSTNDFSLSFRARPDCAKAVHNPIEGKWNTYVLDIHWTNTDKGYYKLFLNGKILFKAENVKTVFDMFPGLNGYSTCDLFWSLGVYSRWLSTSRNNIKAYFDDIAVYDKDKGATLLQVCPGCEEN